MLETERLLLHPLTLEHVDLLVALDSDPEVMRYLSGGRATPRADIEEAIRLRAVGRFVAFERTTGEFVGWIGLRATDAAGQELELGYRLRREMWGRGFATEASRFLTARAFAETNAARIWAQTMAVNSGSRAVMERCGLRYFRTVHDEWPDAIPGHESGDVEYELRRPDAVTMR